jgi:GT2 family glycosyltransferase
LRFAAAVVTFNRKVLLGECLHSLLQQTRVPDCIYVIDNASSDGTTEYLKELGLLEHPRIRYQRLEHNSGGAGGFHAGLKAAYDAGEDWIWIMDDDAEPLPDALERMLPYTEYPQVVGIASSKIDSEGSTTGDLKRLQNGTEGKDAPYERLQFSSFVGIAISRKAIDQIGLPKVEFFIHHDDTEYCLRLIRVGDIAHARDSFVRHKEARGVDRYKQRFGRTFKSFPTDRYVMGYFGRRNQIWLDVHFPREGWSSAFRHFRDSVKMCLRATLIDREDVLIRCTVTVRAFTDGLTQNFDNGLPFRLRAKLRKSKTRGS